MNDTRAFRRELEWIRRNMPLTRASIAALPDLTGVRLACNMHLDPKMFTFVDGVLRRGAELHLSTCNTETVSDAMIAEARDLGATTEARRGMSREDWAASIAAALAWKPTHLCEMGAELSAALHGTNPLLPGRRLFDEGYGGTVRHAMEATGSGISRLEEIDAEGPGLGYPVFNWDDIPVKEGLHNRHMVGLTAWHTFFERTGLTLHGKRVVVVGYGSVGRGVADAARAYGSSVTVAEADPGRRWEASFAGYPVGALPAAAAGADVVVTATGRAGVVSLETIDLLADGAFLLNVGHLAHEIDTEALRPYRGEEIIPAVREYRLEGKSLFLLAEGSMVNLSAGRGDSINAFDITLAVMTATLGHMVSEPPAAQGDGGIHPVPPEVWRRAAEPDGGTRDGHRS